MKLTIKQTRAIDFLEDNITEELYFGGGAGGAKSALGCYWQLKRRLKYPGSRGFIGRAEMKILKDTTLKTFLEIAQKQGVIRGKHFDLTSPQDKEDPNCIKFINGSLIFLRDLFLYPSDSEFESLGSLEITDAFVDECGNVTQIAKDTLKTRIRYGLQKYNLKPKILFASNPVKGWPYIDFYQPWKKGTLPEFRQFVPALATDNPHVDPSYINSLRNLPEGSQKQRLLYGNWDYDDSSDTLCEYDAINDIFTNDHVAATGVKRISADLAMQGRDKFIAGSWDGLICKVEIDQAKSTGASIEADIKALMLKQNVGRSNTVVDSDGMGAYLESYLKGIKEFHGGAQAIDKVEFANMKAECGWKLAEFVNKRQIKVICNQYQREQITREIGVLKAKDVDKDETRKRLISKEEMKEYLGGKSPDYLDMLLMGMIFHVQHQFKVSAA